MIQVTTAKSITNIDSLALKDYMHDMSRYKLLTIDEEKYIGTLVKRGDLKARQKLITANLRFAITVAKHYQGRGLPLEDLISEANAGLCVAAERWDVDLGYRFITYALWWMRQCITNALTNKSRTVRISQGPVNILFKMKIKEQEYYQKYGEKPTEEKLAELCKCTVSQLQNAIFANKTYLSLDKQMDTTDPDTPTILEAIPNPNIDSTDTAIIKENIKFTINKVLNSKYFTDIERDIIKKYYGLDDPTGRQLLLKDLATQYGKTSECIRQKRNKALAKMRKYFGKTLKSLI